jgi:hypothetical protein
MRVALNALSNADITPHQQLDERLEQRTTLNCSHLEPFRRLNWLLS